MKMRVNIKKRVNIKGYVNIKQVRENKNENEF